VLQAIDVITLIGIVVFLVQLILEKFRWQMVPIYAGILLISLNVVLRWRAPRIEQRTSILRGVLGLLALLLILLPSIVFPVPRLRQPSGDFNVGTQIVYIRDSLREEIYTEDPSDVRELNVQIWYPAAEGSEGDLAPYMANLDLAGPAFARFLGLPSFVLNHVNLVKTHSIQDAPVAPAGGPYPVLIFSHGWGGTRTQSTFLMEELASQGYVVAAIDHPYGALVTVYPDGRVVEQKEDILSDQLADGAFDRSAKGLVSGWSADTQFVLNWLEAANSQESGDLLSGHLDLDRVGFLGHSTGGGNAVQSCWAESRCDVGFAMDAWLEPVSDAVIESHINQPFMFLWSEEWGSDEDENMGLFDGVFGGLSGGGYSLEIAGTRHYDFSDLPLLSPLSPWFGLKGPIDGRRVLDIISRYAVAFFDSQLKGEGSELLAGPSTEYPEVKFQIKSVD
jgi:acetyl esterase/lipase